MHNRVNSPYEGKTDLVSEEFVLFEDHLIHVFQLVGLEVLVQQWCEHLLLLLQDDGPL